MMDGLNPLGEGNDDMARRTGANRSNLNEAKVDHLTARLKAVGLDRHAFGVVHSDIGSDPDLTVNDVIEIAIRYRGGGTRPASRKAALGVISKRFLELVRSQAQIDQAHSARPW